VRAIGMIAYGAHVRPFTPGNDRHEMDKRLVAEIMEGKPILAMDNVNATLLRSNTLASLLTERPAGVRILGQSRMVTLEHASFIALTGNGLTVSEDLARRFLFCELDAHCEDPERRSFEPGFIDSIRMDRSGLLSAALTIWRWGRQTKMNRGIPLGSFEEWGVWVRDPLLALGCPDPVDRVRQIKERDPARQRVIELFAAWWETHRDSPIRVADLAPEVREIVDPSQRGRQYLARAIQNLIGTRQGGFTLERVAELPNKRKVGSSIAFSRWQTHPRHPHHPHSERKTTGKAAFLRVRMTRMPPTTRIWAWIAKMLEKTRVRTRKVRMTRMMRMTPGTTLPAAATTAARLARPAAGTGPDGRTASGCICAAKSRGSIKKRQVA